jgi:hypothetical protein
MHMHACKACGLHKCSMHVVGDKDRKIMRMHATHAYSFGKHI